MQQIHPGELDLLGKVEWTAVAIIFLAVGMVAVSAQLARTYPKDSRFWARIKRAWEENLMWQSTPDQRSLMFGVGLIGMGLLTTVCVVIPAWWH